MRAFVLLQQSLLLRLLLLRGVRCKGTTTVELHTTVRADFTCRDPFLGGPTSPGQGLNRKWIALGLVEEGTGLGNLLLFFPSAYYFAAFTSREIVLLDTSNIGLFCQVRHCFRDPASYHTLTSSLCVWQVIRCGFPLVSEARGVYPVGTMHSVPPFPCQAMTVVLTSTS